MMKKLFKVLAILFVLLAGFLGWALQQVDYRPYFFAGYYKSTAARLDSLAAHLAPAEGPLEIGFGRASLTPDLRAARFAALPLAGYGARHGQPAEGVHDSLFVKAVALRAAGKTLVLTSMDALIVPVEISAAVASRIRETTGLAREQLLFSATHTHAGVGGWGEGLLAEGFAGAYNPEVRKWLGQQITAAIQAALRDLTPGRMGAGSFRAPQFVRNRLVKQLGWKDDEFTFAVCRQDDGDAAILGSFAAHATTLSDRNMLLSGDYPGYWQRAVEKRTGAMAVFFAGGVGSHGPAGEGRVFEKARRLGEALADSVSNRFAAVPLQAQMPVACLGLPVDLPDFQVRVSDNLRLHPALAARLLQQPRQAYLQIFRLGRLLWVATPCDFSGELALDLKNLAHRQSFAATITSFNGSYAGYIVPGKYYHYNAYESRFMSWYGPYMGAYFDELIRRLMHRMIAAGQPQVEAHASGAGQGSPGV